MLDCRKIGMMWNQLVKRTNFSQQHIITHSEVFSRRLHGSKVTRCKGAKFKYHVQEEYVTKPVVRARGQGMELTIGA